MLPRLGVTVAKIDRSHEFWRNVTVLQNSAWNIHVKMNHWSTLHGWIWSLLQYVSRSCLFAYRRGSCIFLTSDIALSNATLILFYTISATSVRMKQRLLFLCALPISFFNFSKSLLSYNGAAAKLLHTRFPHYCVHSEFLQSLCPGFNVR